MIMRLFYKIFTVVILSMTWNVQAHSEDEMPVSSGIENEVTVAEFAGRIFGNLQSAVNNCDGIYQSFGSDTDLSHWKRKFPKAFDQGFEIGFREGTLFLSHKSEAGQLPAGCDYVLDLYGPEGSISPGHLVTSLSNYRKRLKTNAGHS